MKTTWIVLTILLSACIRPAPYELKEPIAATERDKKLMQQLATVYPREFTLKQRIIITAQNKQYDMIGYLIFRQPDRFYAAAYFEAGAPVFELVHANGKGRVLNKPKYLPEVYLRNGIMSDLLHIYSNKNPIAGQVIARDSQSTRFVFPRGNGYFQEYFVNKSGEMFSSKTGYRGELLRTVRYSDHRTTGHHSFAQTIYLKNYDVRYEMQISLLEVSTSVSENFEQKLGLVQ